MSDPLTEAEGDALRVLAENHRLLITLVPEDIPDGFVARLTAWQNFCLDTRLLPPLWVPAMVKGDGLVCPFCGTVASQAIGMHDPKCAWRQGAERYGSTMLQIDAEFREVG